MSEKCSSQYREPHGSPMGEGASTISPVALRAAVPTNSSTLTVFLFHVTHLWRRTLRQRSQKDWTTWERIKRLADDWLPKPRILHPWPASRFAVRHPRWEKLWGGRRRSWHLHRPYEPMEVSPWPKSMISA